MPAYVETPSSPAPGRASEKVAEELRRLVITLELAPGSVVSESYLAERLGCGRTPLREALQRLAGEHLIVSVPKLGIAVAGLSMLEFADLSDMLAVLDGFAVRLAVERISNDQLSELDEVVAQAEKALDEGNFSSTAELDVAFHRVIGGATGNRYLADTMTNLHRLVTRFSHIVWRRQGEAAARQSLDEHHQILASLRARNADEADRLSREHSSHARERVRASL